MFYLSRLPASLLHSHSIKLPVFEFGRFSARQIRQIRDMSTAQNRRVLSIQSHVVHGHVGNKSAVFPLQVRN